MMKRRRPADFVGNAIDPDATYRAVSGFASERAGVVRRGDELQGDDPRIAGHERHFLPRGAKVPSADAAAAALGGTAPTVHETRTRIVGPPTDDDYVVPIKTITRQTVGMVLIVRQGEPVRTIHPLVKVMPELFIPLAEHRARERAADEERARARQERIDNPRDAHGARIEADREYVAIESMAVADDAGPDGSTFITPGDRRRGDDPIVRSTSEHWAAVTT